MTWDTTLAALQTWVTSASGLSATNVRWSGQGGMRPTTPWISLQVIAETAPGPDWADNYNTDPIVTGAEVGFKIRGGRIGTLSIQCFGGATVGLTSPFGILRKLYAGARSPSRRIALSAAGIGLGNIGQVLDVPAIINTTNFEARAVMTLTFFTASEVIEATETDTFIETVDIIGTADDGLPSITYYQWPSTAAIALSAFGYGTWASIWRCNEMDGSLIDDVGDVTLIATGLAPATYRLPGAFPRDYAIQAGDIGTDFIASSSPTSYNITTTGQIAIYACIKLTGLADDFFLGKFTPGYYCITTNTSGHISIATFDGTTTRTATVAVNHFTGEFVDILAIVDRTNGFQRIVTSLGDSGQTVIDSGSLTTSGAFQLSPGVSGSADPIFAYIAIADGDMVNLNTNALDVIENIQAFTGRD